jgi:Choline dehydrogenase and related flavoproteins
MLGNIKGEMIRSAYTSVPKFLANWLGRHSVDILVMSEDLPNSESRVRLLENGAVKVEYKPGAKSAHQRFVRHVKKVFEEAGFPFVLQHSFGIHAPSHQSGTIRMGDDPKTSVLNAFCRSHDHSNLFVVDGSFFPSSAALNPALTIAAQALRVGEHIRRSVIKL